MSDLHDLLWLGERLDQRMSTGRSVLEALMPMLQLRDRSGDLVPLALNHAQRELAAAPSLRKIILKARQLGITTYIAARFFLKTITRPGTLTVQVAHDQESAEQLFKIVHRFYQHLPEAMRAAGTGVARTSRANLRQLVFPALDSEYRVETAADPNAGRGLTIQNLHCSEVARWPRFAAETLASLRAAVPAAGEIVLESTPNGAAGCFYQEWQRAHETGYTRHFFPWWYEPTHVLEEVPDVLNKDALTPDALTEEERELMARFALTPRQIAFRRSVQANFCTLAPQEFCEDAESCFLASGECFFDLEVIEKRLAACAQQYSEYEENGALRIWYPPSAAREYVIGSDPAGGGAGGDYACAQVVDLETGLQCAELCGHFPPQDLALKLAELARRYNHALVVVERNNHGHGVIAHLSGELALERGAGKTTSVHSACRLYEKNGQTGWLTTAANRPRMLANFAAALVAAPQLFNSESLLQECRTFVRHENGVAAAAAGSHDDRVMAMAIALAARAEILPGSRNGTARAECASEFASARS